MLLAVQGVVCYWQCKESCAVGSARSHVLLQRLPFAVAAFEYNLSGIILLVTFPGLSGITK